MKQHIDMCQHADRTISTQTCAVITPTKVQWTVATLKCRLVRMRSSELPQFQSSSYVLQGTANLSICSTPEPYFEVPYLEFVLSLLHEVGTRMLRVDAYV